MKNFIHTGFTLIELMIVVGIISIFASVAIPTYQSYTKDAANHACMAEANSYARKVYADIQLNKSVIETSSPIASACTAINDGQKVTTIASFISIARPPGNATITCDLHAGTPCSITAFSP